MNEFGNDREIYAQHLDSEHRRLNTRLSQVRRIVSASCGSQGAALKLQTEVMHELQRLRQELAQHFANEEEGGVIEEAACLCPTLTHEVRSIEKEHAALLARLDRLIVEQQVERPPGTALAEFDGFIEAIREHEGHETRVVQRGFNLALDA